MSKKFEYVMALDVEQTFPQGVVFLRKEEAFKYVDGKRTEEIEGYRVFVMDMNTMTEVSIKVFGQVGDLKPMKPVHFENLEIKPYVQRSGNFSNIAYSVTASGISQD